MALKRLEDAIADGNRIHGVIRAIGLSNDGRQAGFLAPSAEGPVRAMQAAYRQSDVRPEDIHFIECHATGTPRGDTVELGSLAEIWGDGPKPVIGSLKANIGHPITASGVASLMKVLGSFDAQLLPPTPCDDPLPDIAEHGFRILSQAEPWQSEGPRRAASSNFGFGGTNAHLVVEEWTGQTIPSGAEAAGRHRTEAAGRPDAGGGASRDGASPETAGSPPPMGSGTTEVGEPAPTVAVTGMGVLAGEDVGLPAFVRRLVGPREAAGTRTDEVDLSMSDLGFPPNDLQESLAQQTSILAVLDEALAQVGDVDPRRTGVYIGMCVDPEAARHGLRVRLRELLAEDADPQDADVEAWRQANARSARHLTSAGVIGCMPNIPANRVHARQDWTAPGFTVAGEELSGLDALKLAMRALQAGEVDAAIVGASDFSHEPAHVAAAERVLPEDRRKPGDAAVALVLMRETDAVEEGRPVLALRADARHGDQPSEPLHPPVTLQLDPEAGESEVTARFGHAHGASGLLHVAAGVVTAHLGAKLDPQGAWPAPRRVDQPHTKVAVRSYSGLARQV